MASLLKEFIISDDAKLTWSQCLKQKTINQLRQTFSRQSTRIRRTMSRAVDWNDPISYMKRISGFQLSESDPLPDGSMNLRSLSGSFSRNVSYINGFVRSFSQKYLETILLAFFGVELLVRFLAGGLSEFLDEGMNVIDFLVVMISYWNIGPKRKFVNLTPIRMLRWFYIKRSKRTHRGGEGVPILAAILRSVGQLSAVYDFLFVVIVIFSIFSMELWSGQMNFTDGYPRANHDSFGQAILLWFTVTTGESWVDYMWDAMRPGVKYRWVAPFVFVVYFIITAFITLNLIIAAILEETELTDKQKKYIQKREHLKWLQVKHYQHLSSMRGSDWIIDAVEGAHKSFSYIKRRMTSIRVSRMSTFSSFISETIETRKQEKINNLLSLTKESISIDGPHASTPQLIQTKRASYSVVRIPGSIENDRTLNKAKIVHRSSTSVLPMIDQESIKHIRTQEANPLLIRSGFHDTNITTGESNTALQSALLAVVDDKTKVATKNQNEDSKSSPIVEGEIASYGRTKSGRRISFVLSEFGASPAFEVRALPWWMNHRSLFLFAPENYIRRYIIRIVEHKLYTIYDFGYIILGMWLFVRQEKDGFYGNDTTLTYELYVDPRINKAYTIFLGVDILLKIIAYGFLFTPEAFLSDPYNWMEIPTMFFAAMGWTYFCCLGISKYEQTWNNTAILMVKFRPVILVGRFRGMRTLMNNIAKTMPIILKVFGLVLVIYAIFAVIGIQLYASRFRYCTDSSVVGHIDCVGLFRNELGIMAIRTWVNQPFHFDTFGDAMLALLVGSTFDNWLDYFLYHAMDLAHKPELQPQRNINPSQALYFITFMCIGGFFVLRMFVGVFIDQFGIISGSKLLTERQKLWRDTNRLIQGLSPKIVPIEPSYDKLR